MSAAVTHDGCCLSVGVTTVFDSLSIGSFNAAASRNHDNLVRLAGGLETARAAGMLKAEHRLHWRCETPADDLPDRLETLAAHPMTGLFSLMDHTPGQRQYRNLARHLAGWADDGMTPEAIIADHPRLISEDIRAAQAFAADYLADEALVYG